MPSASSESDWKCDQQNKAIKAVIPGRCEASNPESRDSGSGPSDHPGMTEPGLLRRVAPRNDGCRSGRSDCITRSTTCLRRVRFAAGLARSLPKIADKVGVFEKKK